MFELCAVLLLAAIAASVLLPAVRHVRDLMAVLAAREAVAGLVSHARTTALAHGGAEVRLENGPWRAWVAVEGDTAPRVAVEDEFGVRVGLSGARTATSLRYDALGLGSVASETLRFRRGGVERLLVISGYGRVRRP